MIVISSELSFVLGTDKKKETKKQNKTELKQWKSSLDMAIIHDYPKLFWQSTPEIDNY